VSFCAGTAALGRGAAAMPAAAARGLGAAGALAHLASDAVRAAAESPFLEAAGPRSSAVLCSLSLPPPRRRSAGARPAGRATLGARVVACAAAA
jgi:hypothetical protein